MQKAAAAAAKIIARKSRPLPRNTVAKNWSSKRPRRLRAAAMSHRKKISAKRIDASASSYPDRARSRKSATPAATVS